MKNISLVIRNTFGKNEGRLYKSLEAYSRAIDIKPHFSDNYWKRALTYKDLAREEPNQQASLSFYMKATEDYDHYISLNPDPLRQVYEWRAQAYVNLREYEKAISDLSEAIRMGSGYAYWQKGFVYALMGLDGEAASSFRLAYENDPHGKAVVVVFAENSSIDSENCYGISKQFWPIICPDKE